MTKLERKLITILGLLIIAAAFAGMFFGSREILSPRRAAPPTIFPAPAPSIALTPTPTPAFSPDPDVLAFTNAVLAQRPWLEAHSSDPSTPPGISPATTFFTSRAEPVIVKDGDTWRITFKP